MQRRRRRRRRKKGGAAEGRGCAGCGRTDAARRGGGNDVARGRRCSSSRGPTGGKSTVLRSIAAATLLAACGLLVPCDEAAVPATVRTVFLRAGASDVAAERKSTFAAEMHDWATMLRVAGAAEEEQGGAAVEHVVLVDEPCRGTATRDGRGCSARCSTRCRARRRAVTTHFRSDGAAAAEGVPVGHLLRRRRRRRGSARRACAARRRAHRSRRRGARGGDPGGGRRAAAEEEEEGRPPAPPRRRRRRRRGGARRDARGGGGGGGGGGGSVVVMPGTGHAAARRPVRVRVVHRLGRTSARRRT